MTHHRGTYGQVLVTPGHTQAQCFLACVRHGSCRAFNLLPDRGRCELLPPLPECAEPEEDPRSLFVHLTECSTEVPFKVVKPTGSGGRWVRYNESTIDGFSSDIVPVDDTGYSFIFMNFYEGLYLTGYQPPPYENDSLGSFVLPSGKQKTCKGTNVLSIHSYRDHHKWQEFTIEQEIPENAIVGGQFRDGSPLFILRKKCRKEDATGYYHPVTNQTGFHCDKISNKKPTFILLYI